MKLDSLGEKETHGNPMHRDQETTTSAVVTSITKNQTIPKGGLYYLLCFPVTVYYLHVPAGGGGIVKWQMAKYVPGLS